MTLAILADDLTGACDAAAPFARLGLTTEVILDLAQLTDGPEEVVTMEPGHVVASHASVLSADVDTRRLGRRLAATRTAFAARTVRVHGATLLYKKIDSTLRGHVATELDATLRAWDAPLAIVCPAFPAVGRWVQGGHLFVDRRGDLGEVAALAGLVGGPARSRPVALLGLAVVGQGADAVVEALERARGVGAQIVVADANTPGHLTALAQAATRLDPAPLLVGSAGLAAALADQWVAANPAEPARQAESGHCDPRNVPTRPWLVVCGSQTDVTRDQVVELARAGAEVIELQIDELIGSRRVAEVAGARAAQLIWGGKTPVLRLVVSPDATGVPSRGPRLDERAARALARACRAAVAGAQPAGLFLTGGSTARACLLALGARGLRLDQEPLPGIAAGRALGGAWDGRALITKSGGFGAPDAIRRLVYPHRG